jgi:hypothetical protein
VFRFIFCWCYYFYIPPKQPADSLIRNPCFLVNCSTLTRSKLCQKEKKKLMNICKLQQERKLTCRDVLSEVRLSHFSWSCFNSSLSDVFSCFSKSTQLATSSHSACSIPSTYNSVKEKKTSSYQAYCINSATELIWFWSNFHPWHNHVQPQHFIIQDT